VRLLKSLKFLNKLDCDRLPQNRKAIAGVSVRAAGVGGGAGDGGTVCYCGFPGFTSKVQQQVVLGNAIAVGGDRLGVMCPGLS
jgi:hypothetical protein